MQPTRVHRRRPRALAAFFVLAVARSASADITAGDSVLVDFNVASDADDFFVTKKGNAVATDTDPNDLDFNFVAGQGVGGSGTGFWGPASNPTGALGTSGNGINNDASALYAPGGLASDEGLISLAVGDTFTTSVKIQLDSVNLGPVPSIGFVAEETIDPNNQAQIGGPNNANSTANSMNTIFRWDGTQHVLAIRNAGFDAPSITMDSTGFSATTGEWYTLRMVVEKTSIENTFNVAGELDRLSADGSAIVEANFRQISAVYESQSLYTDEWRAGVQLTVDTVRRTVSRNFDDFSISVTGDAPLLGDYNGDELVNAADYTVWRDSLNSVGADLPADGDGDMDVDADDYLIWRASFLASSSGSGGDDGGGGDGGGGDDGGGGGIFPAPVSAPEPHSLTVLLGCSLFFMTKRARSN